MIDAVGGQQIRGFEQLLLLVQGLAQPQAAGDLQLAVGQSAGLDLLLEQIVVVLDGPPQPPRVVAAELRDDAVVVLAEAEQDLAVVAPAGAAGDLVGFEQHHLDAFAGQPQRGRHAADPATDDDDVGSFGQRSGVVRESGGLADPQRGVLGCVWIGGLEHGC